MIVRSLLRRLSGELWSLRYADEFTTSPGPRPRLLVDVSQIIRRDDQTGIQRVVRSVWSELARRNSADFDVVPVFASAKHGYHVAPLDFLDRQASLESRPIASASRGDRFLGLDLTAHIMPNYVGQLKRWRDAGTTINLVVYDLLPMLFPQWFRRPARVHFARWLRMAEDIADQLLCISPQVARDVREHLRTHRSHGADLAVSSFRMGANIAASRPSQGTCETVDALVAELQSRPSVLMVGTVEPRKAYDVALRAFEHLWQTAGTSAPDLVIVGKPGWRTEELQRTLASHPEQGHRLHWLSSASDEALTMLYDKCDGLLMTSHAEGFGLPLIEAASHGLPILARDIPVFREQGVRLVTYFKDDSPAALGTAIMDFLGGSGVGGSPQRDFASWSTSVDDLLESLGLGEGRVGVLKDQVPQPMNLIA